MAQREPQGRPVYRADLTHLVKRTEHGKAVGPARPQLRADLTVRRVGGTTAFGMTEEAKASGNALDMPTSVWSILAREQAELPRTKKANDG